MEERGKRWSGLSERGETFHRFACSKVALQRPYHERFHASAPLFLLKRRISHMPGRAVVPRSRVATSSLVGLQLLVRGCEPRECTLRSPIPVQVGGFPAHLHGLRAAYCLLCVVQRTWSSARSETFAWTRCSLWLARSAGGGCALQLATYTGVVSAPVL